MKNLMKQKIKSIKYRNLFNRKELVKQNRKRKIVIIVIICKEKNKILDKYSMK